MEWLRMHRYAASLLAASFLLASGTYIVKTHSAGNFSDTVGTWGGGGILVNPVEKNIPAVENAPQELPAQTQSHSYISPFGTKSSASENPDATQNAEFNSILAQLSGPPPKKPLPTLDTSLDPYAFIPSSIPAYTGTEKEPSLTPSQEALKAYGNDIGNSIQAYEDRNRDAAQILKNFMEDRTNTAKKEAQKKLGNELIAVGKAIESAQGVPKEVAAPGAALAKSYQEIGANLAAIPDNSRNEDIVAAVTKYNASADRFVQNFIAISLLFQSYGVRFDSGDPGSVFVLQMAPSL
jgi:hypothetical protein